MNINQYQKEAKKTAVYPEERGLEYLTLGLVGEAGEVAEVIKKHIRGDYSELHASDLLLHELGDVLWYLTMLADHVGFRLSDIAEANLEKLQSRETRGVLKGSGDFR